MNDTKPAATLGPETERKLAQQAQDAINRSDIPEALRYLTDIVTYFPHNQSALTSMLDLLMMPWFPDREAMNTMEKLVSLSRSRFPDSLEIQKRAQRLEVKRAQTEAVEEGYRRLAEFEGIHKGKRCVIIGNGPSLNKMDLSFLNNEYCFGLNRIYLGFERFGFTPTYLVSVNKFVLEQSAGELADVPCTKFISFEGVPHVKPADDLIVINPRTWEDFFSTDPRQGLCIGSTVTYVAMQLAFWMGFDDVVLIGVDHRFATQGTPHKIVESQGDDPNHFDPGYFGKGFTWQLPDLKNSEQVYRIADAYFRAYRHKIVDATVDGACPVFEKADYRELFF
jgi:hypothetical protein